MASSKKFRPVSMVNWYNPSQLLATVLKAIVSGKFANYADKRELQAALDPKRKVLNFSIDRKTKTPLEEIWIDFVSDTGDGFNSTYTVADLIAQPLQMGLNPDYHGNRKTEQDQWNLPTGQLLLLAGDQVYPTPTLEEYELRFMKPYRAASKKFHIPLNLKPRMVAIPGNHDWYDGLGNFLKLFCQKRRIGNWRTIQNRSYFAVKLPHNYWLWATDIQLNSDIDQPQKDYFMEVAVKYMQDGDKVIMVTAEPAWVYKVIHRKDASYRRLKYFEQVFITEDKYKCTGGKKFKLVATLTGDFHHYTRYEEHKKAGDGSEYINHLITAGGGGSFLHPTHNLPKTLKDLDEKHIQYLKNTQFVDPEMKMCFPSRKTSRRLANRALLFPFYNIAFWISMSLLQLLIAWIVQSKSPVNGIGYLDQLTGVTNIGSWLEVVASHLLLNPTVVIFSVLVVFAMTAFTDSNTGKRNYKWVGFIHGMLQALWIFFSNWLFACFNSVQLGIDNSPIYLPVYVAETFLIGGFISSCMMGLYLWFTNCFLNIHLTECFSAFTHPHYKNFLRIHVRPDATLAIYPVGIEKVVTDWKKDGHKEDSTFTSSHTAKYYLIEPPIIIGNT